MGSMTTVGFVANSTENVGGSSGTDNTQLQRSLIIICILINLEFKNKKGPYF